LDDAINHDENLLDGLQPPQNLKYLFVLGYGGARFSIWLSSLTNLTELLIWDCKKCQHVPPLHEIERPSNIWLTLMFKHYLLEHHVFCSYQNIAKLDDFTGMDWQPHVTLKPCN
ncbi:putative disease resistance protein rga1, partial [Quercus suber]